MLVASLISLSGRYVLVTARDSSTVTTQDTIPHEVTPHAVGSTESDCATAWNSHPWLDIPDTLW